eukprot:217494-Pelagomonas_calceolata.AAC.1
MARIKGKAATDAFKSKLLQVFLSDVCKSADRMPCALSSCPCRVSCRQDASVLFYKRAHQVQSATNACSDFSLYPSRVLQT